jgi:hypothetical protein
MNDDPRRADLWARDPRAFLEGLQEKYEAGGLLPLGPKDWPRLTALLDRLDREGVETATEDEAAWLTELDAAEKDEGGR